MTLFDVVESLSQLDNEQTIYSQKPWSPSSVAITAIEPEKGGLPDPARQQSLHYFIEVSIAQDFLMEFAQSIGRKVSVEERCRRLIRYAATDA